MIAKNNTEPAPWKIEPAKRCVVCTKTNGEKWEREGKGKKGSQKEPSGGRKTAAPGSWGIGKPGLNPTTF